MVLTKLAINLNFYYLGLQGSLQAVQTKSYSLKGPYELKQAQANIYIFSPMV